MEQTSSSSFRGEIHGECVRVHELLEARAQGFVELVLGRHAGEEAGLGDG